MQSVTLKIRKKGKLSYAEIIEKYFLMNDDPFRRSPKTGGMVINVYDVCRYLHPRFESRKAG